MTTTSSDWKSLSFFLASVSFFSFSFMFPPWTIPVRLRSISSKAFLIFLRSFSLVSAFFKVSSATFIFRRKSWFVEILEITWFSSIFSQFWWNAQYCACLTNADRGVRRECDIPRVSGSRFPARTHALDSLEYISSRFDDFYFRRKSGFFGNSWKSMTWAHFGYPGWVFVTLHPSSSCGRAGGDDGLQGPR